MRGSKAVDIVGRACRLPGAADCAALWRVLAEGRCTVGAIGEDRWAKARFYNPRQGERGKTYTFAAGALDDIWGFDPGPFGISPREAEQMDPQQRLLLQVVWEALEDAGVPPSTLAGAPVGVYVGVSSPDTATRRAHDVGTSDAFTMTGSTLSLVANRISYVFDWRGPSLIVDTACSSSLVALSQALDALQAGRIDTAVVGGVNLLLSPFPFLGFSAARMLSPDGRCRPFDAAGQGYVRAEGAVALVLRRRNAGPIGAGRCYAEVVAAGVNSDGRTSGVSLPSADSQAALLASLYPAAGVDPDDLAFVEAHGTGTRVGDPAEAEAIGRVLGRPRRAPLPIGSIKSNIGHLEPAAGLSGMLKAMLAFEHDLLPASLFFETPNPAIAFADLNLAVAGQALALPRSSRPRLAGVSSFGFGGTNAHVILRENRDSHHFPARSVPTERTDLAENGGCPHFPPLMLSAHCAGGLAGAVEAYRARIVSGESDVATLAANAAHYREAMPERVAIAAESAEAAVAGIDAFLAGAPSPAVITGRAVARAADVAFIYSGNGAQWVGMGRLAYDQNPAFRARFDTLSRHFAELAGWSMTEALLLDENGDSHQFPSSWSRTAVDGAGIGGCPDFHSASVAQPLLLAIQVALTDALAEMGLVPSLVLGHSVGEIAAAYAAGALDEGQALRVIHARSTSQELARGLGAMAALRLGEAEARRLVDRCGAHGVEIGAINSPRSVTLTGTRDEIEMVAAAAAAEGHRVKVLDLDYPFHSALLDVSRQPLLEALDGLAPSRTRIALVSTVTGDTIAGEALDAAYWWRNVRAPVRFGAAVERAVALGARVLVEISPKAILRGYLAEVLEASDQQTAVIASLSPDDVPGHDPVRATMARALVRGARVDTARAFGRPDPAVRIPHYRWQTKRVEVAATAEATSTMQADAVEHPLLGWRERGGQSEWFVHLDTGTHPEIADHRVGGQVYVPAAMLAEMALAAACRWLGAPRAEVYDLDILAPLVLAADHMREVRTAIEPASRSLTIASRRRLSDEAWQVHVEARFSPFAPAPEAADFSCVDDPAPELDADAFYAHARRLGLDYGPRFRRLARLVTASDGALVVDIVPAADALSHISDPIALDVAFHGLLHRLLAPQAQASAGEAFVPIRMAHFVVHRPSAAACRALIRNIRRGPTSARCDVVLLDAQQRVTVEARGVRFKASVLTRMRPLAELAYRVTAERLPLSGVAAAAGGPAPQQIVAQVAGRALYAPKAEEALLLLEAAARRVSLDAVARVACEDGMAPARLVARGRLSAGMAMPLEGLLRLLEEAGLASRGEGGWRLSDPGASLPPLEPILQTVMAEHPAWWPDCALLAAAADHWRRLLGDPTAVPPSSPPYHAALLEGFAVASPRAGRGVGGLLAAVECVMGAADAPMRVLEIGCGQGALTRPLAELLAHRGGRLLAVGGDPQAVERLQAGMAQRERVEIVPAAAFAATIERHGPFDLVVSASQDADDPRFAEALQIAARHVADRATVMVACPRPDMLRDVVLGVCVDGRPQRGASAAVRRRQLAAAGVADLAECDDAGGHLVVGTMRSAGSRSASQARSDDVRLLEIGPGGTCALIAGLKGRLRGIAVEAPGPLIVCVSRPPAPGEEECDAVAARLDALTRLLREIGDRPARVWIVAPGALRGAIGAGAGCPVQAAVAAYARTATNEHAALDIRLVDQAQALDDDRFTDYFVRLLSGPGGETEVVLDARCMHAMRVDRDGARSAAVDTACEEAQAARLDLSRVPGRERLVWRRVARRAPGPGEVEIEVVATGLNFRDCMWSMGLLPEEALEDGFAGPTLGFECAGRIVGLGRGVTGLSAGQSVIAFAPAAFASHVTVSAAAVAPVPAGMDLEAAATVPVPFITAYYALVHLAQLEEGETVLIHGGAGGVGLAALQIARWRGGHVIVTAGSYEKRSLLKVLGANHVLDSRSLEFADAVMQLTGGAGVDVVLNSLAGEAMERSLALVRPFGRFLELGKRDFYGATKIGLRPFRRNVSYFGIDADQLLAQKPELARRLFAELGAHLEDGTFVPLPYRRFAGRDVGEAFRLMQQSGHVGKVIVAPPRPAEVPATDDHAPFEATAAGAHLVVGGLGGLGLETAQWLAERGARHIVLAGRRGHPDAQGAEVIAALRAKGIVVDVAACDVSEAASVARLLADIRRTTRLCGVVHAAMVLDDDLIARLTPERIERVLAPKVAGASHLDRLTRDDPLQYFVLYSSVTVLIGNPGQAAYVAANGYLEELARRRRTEGRPALAVGWGGITDTGALARDADMARAIARRTGAGAFTADEALAALGELLARGHAAPAAVTVAPMSWSSLSHQLPLLGKPLFRALVGVQGEAVAADGETIDIAAEIRGLDEAAVRERVGRLLAEALARILRMPVADVRPARTLAELGMDSLMGLELRIAVQQRLGVEVPLAVMAGSQSIGEIAAGIVRALRVGEVAAGASGQGVEVDLARQHVAATVDAGTLAPLMRAIEMRESELGARS